MALLWPNADAATARRGLRNALHGVRSRLGEAAILSVGDQLIGVNPALLSCDVHDLERDGLLGLDNGPLSGESVQPLHGLHVRGAAAFDRWLANERARLRALWQQAATDQREANTRGAVRAIERVAHVSRPYAPDTWSLHARVHYLFLRAAHGGTAQDLLQCREYFEQARALDPTFAPAVAGLANFHAVAARRGLLTPFDEQFGRAITLSHEALALDPTLAVPHVHFGVQALYLDDDFTRAGHEFARAVRNDPSYAEGHRFHGIWLGMAGRRGQAVEAMERAVALEPDIALFLSSLGAARLAAGDSRGAEDALRRTLLLEPRHRAARERLVHLLEDEGRLADAVGVREQAPDLPNAERFRAALSEGDASYRALVRALLAEEIDRIEQRVRSSEAPTVEERFAPPIVRLVQLFGRIGDARRAHSWTLQAKAARPALAHWFT